MRITTILTGQGGLTPTASLPSDFLPLQRIIRGCLCSLRICREARELYATHKPSQSSSPLPPREFASVGLLRGQGVQKFRPAPGSRISDSRIGNIIQYDRVSNTKCHCHD